MDISFISFFLCNIMTLYSSSFASTLATTFAIIAWGVFHHKFSFFSYHRKRLTDVSVLALMDKSFVVW